MVEGTYMGCRHAGGVVLMLGVSATAGKYSLIWLFWVVLKCLLGPHLATVLEVLLLAYRTKFPQVLAGDIAIRLVLYIAFEGNDDDDILWL